LALFVARRHALRFFLGRKRLVDWQRRRAESLVNGMKAEFRAFADKYEAMDDDDINGELVELDKAMPRMDG
jgi:hypothetical protein